MQGPSHSSSFEQGLAAADLDPALRLLYETQTALGESETSNATIIASLRGIWLEDQAPATISSDFGARILAQIDTLEPATTTYKAAAFAAGSSLQELLSLPEPLKEIALISAGKSGWSFSGTGVKSMSLETGGRLKAKLLRIEPGHGAPNHDHTGTEYTLVLSGAFHDGTDRYGPGDLSIKRIGQIHHPIATDEGICLALAVEEGGVAFTGALGLIQRMFTRH